MNMDFKRKLPIPLDTKKMFPLTPELAAVKAARDEEIKAVFESRSDKFILIIGPCSADREDSVMDYICRLAKVQEEVKDKIREILIKEKSSEYYEEMYENWKRQAEIIKYKERIY